MNTQAETPITNEIQTAIAATLQVTLDRLPARIIGLKLGRVCGRCAGSGSYSFNQTDGSRCYGCNGRGQVMPKTGAQWRGTLTAAQAAVAAGALDKYLDTLAARKRSRNGLDRAFAAWRAMDELNGYNENWRDATDEVKARNQIGCDLIDGLQELDKGRRTDWIEYDRVLTDGLAKLEAVRLGLAA